MGSPCIDDGKGSGKRKETVTPLLYLQFQVAGGFRKCDAGACGGASRFDRPWPSSYLVRSVGSENWSELGVVLAECRGLETVPKRDVS